MKAQVIDNGAMNYNNAQKRFKISKLEMKVKDNHLHVQIHSPLLTEKNHELKVIKNKLRLKITELPKTEKTIPIPLECDLFLPKLGYKFIKEVFSSEGMISLKITKKAAKAKIDFLSNQQIA